MGVLVETTFSAEGTTEIVTLDEAKEFCRVDTSDDDDLITSLIVLARKYCENKCQVSLVSRTVTAITVGDMRFYLPYGPVSSITSLVDSNSVAITKTTIGSKFPKLIYSAEPNANSTLVYVCTADSGDDYETAIKMIVQVLYDRRGEDANKIIKNAIPQAAEILLASRKTLIWR